MVTMLLQWIIIHNYVRGNNMSSNKLYTRSYFIKRLYENGIKVSTIVHNYDKSDIRYWSIITKDRSKIQITCYKRTPTEYYFKLDVPNGNKLFIDKPKSIFDVIKYIDSHQITRKDTKIRATVVDTNK